MASFPTFPKIEDFDLSKVEWPKFELPKFELPELPKFELPEVDLPSVEQITGFYRDAAYVGIGLAVTTVERLQALQAQLVELVTAQVAKVREAV